MGVKGEMGVVEGDTGVCVCVEREIGGLFREKLGYV